MLKISNRVTGESVRAKATDVEAVSNQPQTAVSNKLTSREFYRDKFEVQKNKEAREEKSAASSLGTILFGPLIGTRVGEPVVNKTDQNKNDLRDMIEKQSEEIKKLEAELAEMYDSNFVTTSDLFSGYDEAAGESNVNRATAEKPKRKTSFDPDND
jgi:hypothetical protein